MKGRFIFFKREKDETLEQIKTEIFAKTGSRDVVFNCDGTYVRIDGGEWIAVAKLNEALRFY